MFTKKHFYTSALAIVAILSHSCQSDIPKGISYTAYTYSGLDEEGGNWQPILLGSVDEISIPAPLATTSTEYQQELDEVKSLNASLTEEQKEILDYWGNNTMIRWMELAEELTAKYFLPPPPGPDGNYPPPSATAPDQIPYFPFAHPPYSSRMFAYVSAAMYDALIAVWDQKYTHNQPLPYEVDGSITPYYPTNDLPGYPNEDAAIATVAEDILIFMFPLEADYISNKASEVRESRKWAGLAVASDLSAGDSIGSYVASLHINRAKNDNMKFAQIDAVAYQLEEDTANMMWGDLWPNWENLDIPQRPVGITPRYGNVTTWWIPDVESVRPGPPPAFGSPEYLEDEAELLELTENATREQERIAFFWSDGPGTWSPPGHWNKIATESIVENLMNPLRTARVLAYMNTAVNDAGISCWDTKYYYFYPRPSQANPDIKALFGIPNFPSYTSGHSTFSGAAAEVLSYFFPDEASYFKAQAVEASESRIYARIHFRFDCEIGVEVGENIGTYAISAAMTDGVE